MNRFVFFLLIATILPGACRAGVVFHVDVNDSVSDIQTNDSPIGPFTVTVQIELETIADSLAAYDFNLRYDQNEVTAVAASLLKPTSFSTIGNPTNIDNVNGRVSLFAAGALTGGFSLTSGFVDAIHGPAIVDAGSIDFTPLTLFGGPSDVDFFVELATDGAFDAFGNDITPSVTTQFGSVTGVPEPTAFLFLAVLAVGLVIRRYLRCQWLSCV